MRAWSLALSVMVGILIMALQLGPWSGAMAGDEHDHGHDEEVKDPAVIAAERDSLMNLVLADIKGREKEPAGEVFENLKIEVLKNMPAGRIPSMMNMGFSRSLGVGCDFCHTVGEWAKDDNKHKQVTREMFAMVTKINGEILPAIEGLDGERPTVNCTTCHRGDKKPAINLD